MKANETAVRNAYQVAERKDLAGWVRYPCRGLPTRLRTCLGRRWMPPDPLITKHRHQFVPPQKSYDGTAFCSSCCQGSLGSPVPSEIRTHLKARGVCIRDCCLKTCFDQFKQSAFHILNEFVHGNRTLVPFLSVQA
jgi:hypothetical protein